jgi:sucrose-6-phosphate hydrolase SacC (GH32 family)
MANLSKYAPASGGWKKYAGNPVLGNKETGTCFDLIVLPGHNCGYRYKMYFSWRPKKSLASALSDNGMNWTAPEIILGPDFATGWEDDINRCAALEKDGILHLWYTGQAHGNSWIGYAASDIGPKGEIELKRYGAEPIIVPEQPWENMSVMNPCVHWDNDQQIYKMWYSAGETYEPNVICHATSKDGINWRKHRANPLFVRDAQNACEQDRIGGCQVLPYKGGYLMFYIGYEDIDTARICGAWSPDGISRWMRLADNPIISPEAGKWAGDACYKPSVAYEEDNDRWLLWYNGRRGGDEYIGLAIHEGEDLGI